MTTLTDRLARLASDGTEGVELLDLPEAKRRRRRHRGLLGTASAAVCLAAIVTIASLTVSTRHGRVNVATQVTLSQSGSSNDATIPKTTPVSGFLLSRLAAVAEAQATSFGDPTPHNAEVLATNQTSALEVTNPNVKASNVGSSVYLLIVSGDFTCSTSCFSTVSSPSGHTLALTLNVETLAVESATLTDREIDLSGLGPVYRLVLPSVSG